MIGFRTIFPAMAVICALSGELRSTKAEPADPAKAANEKRYLEIQHRIQSERLSESGRKAERDSLFRDSLSIKGAEDECLAFDVAASSCLLTIGVFNGRISGIESSSEGADPVSDLPPEEKIGAIRLRVLERFLEPYYLESRTGESGRKSVLDSVLAESKAGESKQIVKRMGEARLREAYSRNFQRYFRKRNIPQLYAVLSSDSAYLDSLVSAMKAPSPPQSGPVGPSAPVRPVRPIWHFVPNDMVPAWAIKQLESGKPERRRPPVRLPFGFAVLKAAAWERVPEIGFEEAVPILSLVESIASHKQADVMNGRAPKTGIAGSPAGIEDVLRLKIRLAPDLSRLDKGRRDTVVDLDTARFSAFACTQRDLPERIREWLEREYSRVKRRSIGPSALAYGVWQFEIEGPSGKKNSVPLSTRAVSDSDSTRFAQAMEMALETAMEKARERRAGIAKDLLRDGSAVSDEGGEMQEWIRNRIRIHSAF